MKILAAIIVPPHLSVSGAARAATRLSDEVARFCSIDVASMQRTALGEAGLNAPGHTFTRVPVRVSNPLGFTERFLPNRVRTLFYLSDIPRLIQYGNYDVVHIHNPTPAIEMMRVAQACVAAGVPYVVSTHGFIEVSQGISLHKLGLAQRIAWNLLVSRPLGYVMRNAAAVAALSPADIPTVRAFGFAGDVIVMVPNGVDLPSEDEGDDAAALERLGVPARSGNDPLCCFFLANHTPNKGVGVLLEAFTRVSRPYLLIVGGDRRNYVDYDGYTRSGDADHRILFTGRLSDAEVAALHRRSDLFVFPTLADTFPLVVLEAMSYGRPVLATRVGGIPYQIDGSTGQMVEPGDAAGLADAVDTLADNRDRLGAMGVAARRRVIREFCWISGAAQIASLYQRLSAPPVSAALASTSAAQIGTMT